VDLPILFLSAIFPQSIIPINDAHKTITFGIPCSVRMDISKTLSKAKKSYDYELVRFLGSLG
jgi:hypothetical protein